MEKFSKTISHTKLKIMQKYGNAEHTVDEEFEAMRLRLENLYRFHQTYTSQMKKYEDLVAQLGSPVLEMASAFTSYYEEEAKFEEELTKQEHLIDGNKCRVIASNISKAANQFTEQQKTLLVEMHAYETSISKMRAHIKTRESLLLDYDNYKNQYNSYKEKDKAKEKNYEQKLSQHEDKYLNAKQKYENFHDQLKRELRELLEKRYETIDSYFQKFALYQIDMFTEAGQSFLVLDNNILEKVTKLNDERRKQNFLTLTENLPKPKTDDSKKHDSVVDIKRVDDTPKKAEPVVEIKRVDDTPKKADPVIEIKRVDDTPKKTDPVIEIKRVDDTPKKSDPVIEIKRVDDTPKKTEPVLEIKRVDDTPKKTEPVIEIKRVDDTPKKEEPKAEPKVAETPKQVEAEEEEDDDEGEQMKALFDYSAAETNELSFKEGDIVTIMNRVEGSDWCKAKLNGKTGLVPANFFEPIKKVVEEKLVAIMDYDASDPDEISFKSGDEIFVMKRYEDNKDWAIGRVNGHVGMFPVSYAKAADTIPKPLKKVKAIIDYAPQDEDEIGFKESDIIFVTQEIEGSDWNKGYVEGSSKIGLFPVTYTEPLSK